MVVDIPCSYGPVDVAHWKILVFRVAPDASLPSCQESAIASYPCVPSMPKHELVITPSVIGCTSLNVVICAMIIVIHSYTAHHHCDL
jgi:hypothetical protein